jgi:hypothetical protein
MAHQLEFIQRTAAISHLRYERILDPGSPPKFVGAAFVWGVISQKINFSTLGKLG